MTNTPDKIVYTAGATVTGGRRGGRAVSDDGILDLELQAPKETGGPGGATNPEQLFAAGYGACFQGAMGLAAKELGVDAGGSTLRAEVGLGPEGESFAIAVTLRVTVPGLTQEQTQELIERTHQLCPYSKAVRGNVPVTLVAETA
ncbi:Ohr subfamily peroxiredoxin [Kineococcus xinjiangensis]|uniref:Ohr subfamily peroxiredoxin n=1 Tax=Kineococcus xinjiangensis TaxID=512762 RepID=A0A2S6ISU1_9ACTN|nr:organic hydroperoxide resistance protein [Kineococcus xinjiangensis]PPK97322.1 Ohr subfamily peroxiredoxin [Kineococcus xinjiangensis]